MMREPDSAWKNAPMFYLTDVYSSYSDYVR
jgi:hypothetical protein